MSFTEKAITVTFQLGEGQFGTSGFDTVALANLRVQCDIAKAGGLAKGALSLRMFGIDLPTMQKLTKVGRLATSTVQNKVSVAAGDSNGMATIYQGSIVQAWPDFSGMPEVAFIVEAQAGYFEALAPYAAQSYRGSVDVGLIMSNLATQIGAGFENNGVNVKLSNPYFPGTAWTQIAACAKQANINCVLDNNVLAIFPVGGSRGGAVPVISAATGMRGYPGFNATGIMLSTEFNPAIVHGGTVQVQSDLKPACGMWRVNMLAHNLESQRPGGAWFTSVEASSLDRLVLK